MYTIADELPRPLTFSSVLRVSDYFSTDDLREVEAAVERVEETTRGEVVAYIAPDSDAYRLAPWKGALVGSLSASLLAALWFAFGRPWMLGFELWIIGPALAGAALGLLLGSGVRPIRRSLVGDDMIDERVGRRAAELFLQEEVFATRDRTGILLFVSLFEHRVVVLADAGIRAAVPEAAWEGLVEALTASVRDGDAGRGLVSAVEGCGRILHEHRLQAELGGPNELEDRPRTEERE